MKDLEIRESITVYLTGSRNVNEGLYFKITAKGVGGGGRQGVLGGEWNCF